MTVRTGTKLDFSIDDSELRARKDRGGPSATAGSIAVAQEMGFTKSAPQSAPIVAPIKKIDGRTLRKKEVTQLNLKVAPEEHALVMLQWKEYERNRGVRLTVAEFVMNAFRFYLEHSPSIESKVSSRSA
ncbi:hypothetical protein [Edaphobacter aggregans]|uniref:hypothetical protein n=1 Tax=Edaphobacter aggregans TaxID=570835 RepID=UPI00055296CC|nr:hypothetical protein [Edaphobacter aggregans]